VAGVGSGRRVTAADIARAAGVSRATVGFVLNATRGQTISDGTRRRVLDAALELGYRPNIAAQALARGRTRTVLLVLPEWPMDHSLRWFVDEVSAALSSAGYTLVAWTPDGTGRARPLWETLDNDLVLSLAPFDDDQLAALRTAGVSRIFPPNFEEARFSSDHGTSGAALQADHLYGLGHRRLAYAVPTDRRQSTLGRARLRAVRDRAAAHGQPPPEYALVDHHDGSADRAVRTWLDHGCTGIVAYNDDVAAVLVSAAVRAGVAVPERLSVIGHDDTPLAKVFLPSLSSVRIDVRAYASRMAAYALHEIEGRPLPPETDPSTAWLTERESTAPAPPSVENDVLGSTSA
jgi:DNA-binding LacI/PurR family transcriptional regulator